ncbi:MAG: cation:proton antiporter [Acidobacteriota bacterium]|nr:cation:proton antiporter [Acidobacteriota bacterium]
MHWPIDLDNPALTLALALAAGMAAQAFARHLRLPGIVLLLGTGVLLGPDVLAVVRPALLGDLLPMLIGFAVAVILFEGGMNLQIKRLRRSARSIRRLITLGALVTWSGGTLAAYGLMGWSWRLSALFGSLVIVTGPTVVNPLLRRLRVESRVATILEAEGVLIDAIGAITAVVALEVAVTPQGAAHGAGELLLRLAFGSALGAVFGLLLGGLLRLHRLIPEGLENTLILSLVLALFQASDAVLEESGIVAVTLAGLVVGHVKSRALSELMEFKEQLTTLLIGLLFVLLAADVRLSQLGELGWRGWATVAALMLVVRPAGVLLSTAGSTLTGRQKLFLSWMAPRGIVAAAVASLFAQRLADQEGAEASQLRALVFLVIAVTVLVQGLSGGWLAQLLGLRRPSNSGYVILGASTIGLKLGAFLRSPEHEVVFLDSNPNACHRAERAGFRVLYGNALSEGLLARAQPDSRAGCIAATTNEEVNLLFARHAREDHNAQRLWVALRRDGPAMPQKVLDHLDARVLFGVPRGLDQWSLRLDKGEATVETWRASRPTSFGEPPDRGEQDPRNLVLPLGYRRGGTARLVDERGNLREGDLLTVVIAERRRAAAEELLRDRGFTPEPPGRAAPALS